MIVLLIQIGMMIKDVGYIVMLVTGKIFDGEAPHLRPKKRVEKKYIDEESAFNLKNYLDDGDENTDDNGNTSLHQATKVEEAGLLEVQAGQRPHMLFILNHQNFTPLDQAINESNTEKASVLLKKSKRFT